VIDFHSTIAKYSKKYSSPLFGWERHRHYLCGVKIVRGYWFKKMVIEIKEDLSQGTGIRLRERYENVCPIWGFEILRVRSE
jgi:hypothetical protein